MMLLLLSLAWFDMTIVYAPRAVAVAVAVAVLGIVWQFECSRYNAAFAAGRLSVNAL